MSARIPRQFLQSVGEAECAFGVWVQSPNFIKFRERLRSCMDTPLPNDPRLQAARIALCWTLWEGLDRPLDAYLSKMLPPGPPGVDIDRSASHLVSLRQLPRPKP